jgi:geranylgeranyl diphosphate synthase type II
MPKTAFSDPQLAAYLKARQTRVEKALASLLKPSPAKDLVAAMNHSLLAGGKRLRPILVMAAAEACGMAGSKVLRAACALECLHTYSLIHDDLPALDDDDLRRGKPTCHKAFGEATAILAGDGLLTLAFQLMAENSLALGRDAEVLRLFALAAGYQGMVAGQAVDIASEGKKASPAILDYIHAHKTGDLLAASLECGAVLAGATPAARKALLSYGRHVGLAFQIADDILNIEGSAKKLGKAVGSDAARKKATYPAVHGLAAAKARLARETQAGLASIRPLGPKAAPLAALARFVAARDH